MIQAAVGLVLAAILLLASPLPAGAFEGYPGQTPVLVASAIGQPVTVGETRSSDHFVVHSASAAMAERALSLAERSWDALSGRFDLLPREPINIVVVEDQVEYERIQPADMTRGFATFGGNSIYLKGRDLDQEVMTHEVAHILLGKNVRHGMSIPDWFNEGFAQFVSRADGNDEEVFYLIASGRLLGLSELDGVDALYSPDRELASIFGLAVVRFLVDEYGQDSLWQLVASLSHSPSFNQALLAAYGRSDLQLSDEWLAYAESEYGIFSLVGLQTVGMAALGLLALTAAVVWSVTRMRLRRRPTSGLDLTPSEVAEAERVAALLEQDAEEPPSADQVDRWRP